MDEMFEKFILKIPQQISNSILLEYADEFPSIFSYKIIKSKNIDARTIEERISYQKELNKRILEELLVFHSYNIRFLGIKGYFLAKEVYEKPEDRIFDDIDILVSNHDIFNFYRKLVSCSYSLVNNQEMFGQNFLLYNNLHAIINKFCIIDRYDTSDSVLIYNISATHFEFCIFSLNFYV